LDLANPEAAEIVRRVRNREIFASAVTDCRFIINKLAEKALYL